ncbi:MAG: IS66 family insertion sequence element accessory protein TnpA [Nitrospiria bacterium]
MQNEIKDYQEMGLAEKKLFWQAHVKGWEQSGISQASYCRDKNLPLKSFWYWRKKFHGRKPPVTFVPVAVKTSPFPVNLSGPSLKLLTRAGFGIEIGDGFKPETLKRLLDTLSGGN